MPTRVKICGITRFEDAEAAVELGAAALGFNFYPPSPRYISPASAQEIVLKLPPMLTAVGVFANEVDAKFVAEVAQAAAVSTLQLHGPAFPSPEEALMNFKLIRAVEVTEGFRPECLQKLRADAFLLDSFDVKLLGGTGRSFDWRLARDAGRFGRIILAGGLTPENVGEAIRVAHPYAVDVASGVELEPGKKDLARVRAFIRAVGMADLRLGD